MTITVEKMRVTKYSRRKEGGRNEGDGKRKKP